MEIKKEKPVPKFFGTGFFVGYKKGCFQIENSLYRGVYRELTDRNSLECIDSQSFAYTVEVLSDRLRVVLYKLLA